MKTLRTVFCVLFCMISFFIRGNIIDGIRYQVIGENSVGVSRLMSSDQSFPIIINIPSNVEIDGKTYKVTSILENAFNHISWVYGVVIPNSVVRIEQYAFSRCDDLHHITIGEGVSYIGDNAFQECIRLNKVVISNLEAWCDITFGGITTIDGVIAKHDLQKYRKQANPLYWAQHLYIGETELTDLVIPHSITEIKDCTFIGGKFKSVKLHDKIQRIGDASFCNCSDIEVIQLPDNLSYVGESAFQYVSNLTHLTLGPKFIGADINAFYGDNVISQITSFNSFPPKIQFSGSYFGGFENDTFNDALVLVPYGAMDKYRADYVWNRFKNIVEMENSEINEISNDQSVSISRNGNEIAINNKETTELVSIFSVNGKLIYSGNESTISIPQKGIYIVCVSGKRFKVSVI